MANKFFGIKVSKQGIPIQQANDNQLIYKDDFTTKTYFDNTNSRIVEGKLPDGNYGMWVSKPGFNAADPAVVTSNGLVFNSNQNVFKVIYTNSITLPAIPAAVAGVAGASTAEIDTQIPIASGALLPALSAYVYGGTNQAFPSPFFIMGSTTAAPISVEVDTQVFRRNTTGTLIVTVNGSNYTNFATLSYLVKFYLFQETAN